MMDTCFDVGEYIETALGSQDPYRDKILYGAGKIGQTKALMLFSHEPGKTSATLSSKQARAFFSRSRALWPKIA